jgi:hypothetical protein
MAKLQPKSRPTWADVKRNLAGFDRAALLSLVQDLYAAHKDNQASKLASAEQGRALNQNRSAIDHNVLPGSESFLHQK